MAAAIANPVPGRRTAPAKQKAARFTLLPRPLFVQDWVGTRSVADHAGPDLENERKEATEPRQPPRKRGMKTRDE